MTSSVLSLKSADKIGLLAAHTVFMPTFATSQSVTRPIARKDGTPVRSVREMRQG